MHGIFLFRLANKNWTNGNGQRWFIRSAVVVGNVVKYVFMNMNFHIFRVFEIYGMFFVVMPVYLCASGMALCGWVTLEDCRRAGGIISARNAMAATDIQRDRWNQDFKPFGLSCFIVDCCHCGLPTEHRERAADREREREWQKPTLNVCLNVEYNIILMMISCVRICVSFIFCAAKKKCVVRANRKSFFH